MRPTPRAIPWILPLVFWLSTRQDVLALGPHAPVRLSLPAGELPERLAVTVEIDGRPRRLELERQSVRGDTFRLRAQVAGGGLVDVPAPPPRTYTGRVVGEPGTLVAASLLPEGLSARLCEAGGAEWCVRPASWLASGTQGGEHLVFAAAAEETLPCGHEAGEPLATLEPPVAPGGAGGGIATCTLKVAELAYDSDYEYYDRVGGRDIDRCLAIIEDGLNATNLIYIRDVKIVHRLGTVLIRTDPASDFYARFPDASSFGSMLVAFRDEWNANRTESNHDVAYLLTSKSNPEYGGLAYVGTVCTSSRYGMGIGSVGYEGILRHELGHNWGASHSCGDERRYIMCGNSIPAISYHNIRVMSAHRDSRDCLEETENPTEPAPPYARPDRRFLVAGDGPIVIEALASDTDPNCEPPRLGQVVGRSALGADVRTADSLAAPGGEAFLYSPRLELAGIDYVGYTARDDAGLDAAGVAMVEVFPRGLVGYYKLDETSGTTAVDSSGHGRDGDLEAELSFATGSVPGQAGGALQFTGVEDQIVTIGHHPRFHASRGITVAAWFRVDAFVADGATIVAKGSSAWRLKRDGTRRTLKFTCTGTTGVEARGTKAVDDGAWHHAAGVYDGRRILLYIDGALDASVPSFGAIRETDSDVDIGEAQWNGAIDEVRIYNFALDAAQVAQLSGPGRIDNPEPRDGAAAVLPGARLGWVSIPGVTQHDLYLGTDAGSVASATTASPEYLGRRAPGAFAPPLEPGTVYFWRVDEVGPTTVQGPVWRFATAFAHSGFSEPTLNASSYTTRPGGKELGFRSVSTPTGGQDPLAAVVQTSSTPTSPVFAQRSVDASTTFDAVDCSERSGVIATLRLQARDAGYEAEDGIAAYLSSGAERRDLFAMNGLNGLSQLEGSGYDTYLAGVPADWSSAALTVSSSTNSSQGSERIDFDDVAFGCARPFTTIAATAFLEPAAGAGSYTPGPGDRELGFSTTSQPSGGAGLSAEVVETGAGQRFLRHRSTRATTTFAPVDLGAFRDVRASVVLRVADTGYEADDSLRVSVSAGAETIDLVQATGSTGLGELASGEFLSFWADLPATWRSARVSIVTASNSTSAAEGFDVALVELVSRTVELSCTSGPPPVTLRRGDANADRKLDLSDGVRILNYLFLGGVAIECLDAADADDTGVIDLTDGVRILNFLFLGAAPLPAPGHEACGEDPSADGLGCEGSTGC